MKTDDYKDCKRKLKEIDNMTYKYKVIRKTEIRNLAPTFNLI